MPALEYTVTLTIDTDFLENPSGYDPDTRMDAIVEENVRGLLMPPHADDSPIRALREIYRDQPGEERARTTRSTIIREDVDEPGVGVDVFVIETAHGLNPVDVMKAAVFAYLRTPDGRDDLRGEGGWNWGDAFTYMGKEDWLRGGVAIMDVDRTYIIDHDEDLEAQANLPSGWSGDDKEDLPDGWQGADDKRGDTGEARVVGKRGGGDDQGRDAGAEQARRCARRCCSVSPTTSGASAARTCSRWRRRGGDDQGRDARLSKTMPFLATLLDLLHLLHLRGMALHAMWMDAYHSTPEYVPEEHADAEKTRERYECRWEGRDDAHG